MNPAVSSLGELHVYCTFCTGNACSAHRVPSICVFFFSPEQLVTPHQCHFLQLELFSLGSAHCLGELGAGGSVTHGPLSCTLNSEMLLQNVEGGSSAPGYSQKLVIARTPHPCARHFAEPQQGENPLSGSQTRWGSAAPSPATTAPVRRPQIRVPWNWE